MWGAEKLASPGGRVIVVGAEPSPQSIWTVSVPIPALATVPLTVTVPSSSMLSDGERTSPGEANSGIGLVTLTDVCAVAVSPRASLRVTTIV